MGQMFSIIIIIILVQGPDRVPIEFYKALFFFYNKKELEERFPDGGKCLEIIFK